MAVDTATTPKDLDVTEPDDLEFRYEGAQNMVQIKTCLARFTEVDGDVTASHTEMNLLDGCTASTAELNILDGVTSTTAELNILDGVTSTTAELNILDGVTSTAAELNILDGVTATTAELNLLDGVTSIRESYANLQDRKTANNAGGTATSGSWQTRTLNTEVDDPDGIVSITINQFTLQAGTYRIRASAPAYLVGHHQIRLYNATDTAVQQSTGGEYLVGTKEYAGASWNVQSRSMLTGRFTIAAEKNFKIEHRVSDTKATNGFGTLCTWGDAIFTDVEIWKE